MKRLILVVALVGFGVSCAPTPPPNLYNATQTKAYNTENAEQAVIALSQTAINLNGASKLSDSDTKLIRDFALAFDTWRVDYANGVGTVKTVADLFTQLNQNLSTVATSTTLKVVLATVQSSLTALSQ